MNLDDMDVSYKIIFAGTPEFAVPALQAIWHSQHQLVAVYTQPDRPSGRGRTLTMTPVKKWALNHDLPIFTPPSLKNENALQQLQRLQADVMVVAAYGLLLPPPILETPHYGCINIHASLLPRWRGASPIQSALLAGDSETGITIMQMDQGLDSGDMLLAESLTITANETAAKLHDRLATLGAKLVVKALDDLTTLQANAKPQNPALVTYAPKIKKTDAAIDWHQSAAQIARQIQAFNPWPVAYSDLEGTRVRIWQAYAVDGTCNSNAGTIVEVNPKGVLVASKEGCLCIQELQLPGGKRITANEFSNAHPDLMDKKFS